VIPDDPELRAALEARSGAPSPDFAARLGASLRRRRPAPNLMPAIAAVVVLGLCAATIGVLVYKRHLQPPQGGVASSPRLGSPTPSLGTPSPTASETPSPSELFMPTDVQLDPATHDVVWAYIPFDDALFRSIDQGGHWQQRSLPRIHGGRQPSISFVDANHGWFVNPGEPETQCNAASVAIWRTVDGAASWQQLKISGIDPEQCKENISLVDLNHGFLTAADPNRRPTIFRTSDGGRTWRKATLPDPPGFVSGDGGFTLRAGIVRKFAGVLLVEAAGMNSKTQKVDQYVFRSVDGGATWTYAATVPYDVETFAFVSATRWMQGASSETTDAGKTWHKFQSDYSDAAPVASTFVYADGQVGYATVRGDFHRTTDGGHHWVMPKTPWLLSG